ncbi:MAG TPA: ACT domain-containing protein [Polyangia bacterium]|nr:ACT domain-containing protein [Polyangia bacterium]
MARDVDDDRLRRLVAEVTRQVAAEAQRSEREGPIASTERGSPARSPSREGEGTLSGFPGKNDLCASCAEDARRRGPRAVITTTGKNQRGIVAKIAQAIAEAGGDIVDIAQTLVSDYFTMIIVVDTAGLEVSFAEFKKRLTGAVSALGAECLVMHEEIVNALQRV